jgi:hypothetical protein
MKRIFFAVAVLVPAFALTQSACKKEESAATSGSGSASVAASAPSAGGAASLTALTSASPGDSAGTVPMADPDKLPPPTAAATQAAKTVSSANYKTELDAIEKEINGIK